MNGHTLQLFGIFFGFTVALCIVMTFIMEMISRAKERKEEEEWMTELGLICEEEDTIPIKEQIKDWYEDWIHNVRYHLKEKKDELKKYIKKKIKTILKKIQTF